MNCSKMQIPKALNNLCALRTVENCVQGKFQKLENRPTSAFIQSLVKDDRKEI